MFNGKFLSILGDSISTYTGVSDNPNINSTLFCNHNFYKKPFPLEKTYWMRLIKDLGFTLCVNNSFSGGTLSDKYNPDSGMNRANHLSKDDGTTPDFIIIFMGINDFGMNVDVSVFRDDYEKTLATVKNNYPNARVCCVNLPDRDARFTRQTKIYNDAIEEAVSLFGDGFFVADLFSSKLKGDFYYLNTLDGLHPNENGMKIIAEVIRDAILKNCR